MEPYDGAENDTRSCNGDFHAEPAAIPHSAAFGDSPLVRLSDRIEAGALVLTVAIVVLAAPVAGAFGTAVHDVRSQEYAQEALTRHKVVATVVQDKDPVKGSLINAAFVYNGVRHTNTFSWAHRVKAGDHIEIWTDDDGNFVPPPGSTSHAGVDAVLAGVNLWLCAVVSSAASFLGLSWFLSCRRTAAWDRETRDLINDGGGPATNQ